MALIRCDFYSDVLALSTSMLVILPQPRPAGAAAADGPQMPGRPAPAPRRKWPALYLLHGLSDDHTTWQRRTSIERYAADLDLAIVMPAVHRSFYTDTAYGHRYWTFVSEEVPAAARSMFPLSGRREDTFAAGLSMGGYGAFKLALARPKMFAAAASLSGALDMARRRRAAEPEFRKELARVFGPLGRIAGSAGDLFTLARRAARSRGPRPRLYQWCGTEDFLYEDNVRFRDHARRLGLDLTYEEGPGAHDWACWDRQIRRVLEWLPMRKPETRSPNPE